MDRYRIALRKFPTIDEIYETAFGRIKEPWEYQTGKRYDGRRLRWFNFSGLRPRGEPIGIKFLPQEPYFQHWVQGDWVVTGRSRTVREEAERVRCPVCAAGHQPNRNGNSYEDMRLMTEFLRNGARDQVIVTAVQRDALSQHSVRMGSRPLRGRTALLASIDDMGFFEDQSDVQPIGGRAIQYPSSISVKLKKPKQPNISAFMAGDGDTRNHRREYAIADAVMSQRLIRSMSEPRFFEISTVVKNKEDATGVIFDLIPNEGLPPGIVASI